MKPLSEDFKVKSLSWSESKKPDSQNRYDYCEAKTPFGCFWISWIGFKDTNNYNVMETPWGGYMGSYGTMEEAKEECHVQFEKHLRLCLDQDTQDLSDIDGKIEIDMR